MAIAQKQFIQVYILSLEFYLYTSMLFVISCPFCRLFVGIIWTAGVSIQKRLLPIVLSIKLLIL